MPVVFQPPTRAAARALAGAALPGLRRARRLPRAVAGRHRGHRSLQRPAPEADGRSSAPGGRVGGAQDTLPRRATARVHTDHQGRRRRRHGLPAAALRPDERLAQVPDDRGRRAAGQPGDQDAGLDAPAALGVGADRGDARRGAPGNGIAQFPAARTQDHAGRCRPAGRRLQRHAADARARNGRTQRGRKRRAHAQGGPGAARARTHHGIGGGAKRALVVRTGKAAALASLRAQRRGRAGGDAQAWSQPGPARHRHARDGRLRGLPGPEGRSAARAGARDLRPGAGRRGRRSGALSASRRGRKSSAPRPAWRPAPPPGRCRL